MKNETIKLDARLQAIADFVPMGSRVADVGTDHAYLCIYLIQKAIAPYAFALDINEKPLENARKNTVQYDLHTAIKIMQSNGLDAVKEQTVDCVVIAGMGGEITIDILKRTTWLQNTQKRIILQPMTGFDLVRCFLYENGYEISQEVYVCVDKKPYCIMQVSYSGIINKIDDVFAYFGQLSKKTVLSEEENLFCQKQLRRVQNKQKGALAVKDIEAYERYKKVVNQMMIYNKKKPSSEID